jgi:hypothetical protein
MKLRSVLGSRHDQLGLDKEVVDQWDLGPVCLRENALFGEVGEESLLHSAVLGALHHDELLEFQVA